jgi:hypothetical protein
VQYSYPKYDTLLSKYGIHQGSHIATNAHLMAFNSSYMLTADNWEKGKSWVMDSIVTLGYKDIWFKMRQGGSTTGPKNWKVEYKVGNGAWTPTSNNYDVVESNYNQEGPFYLPPDCNNQASISVRLVVRDSLRITAGSIGDDTITGVGTSKLKLIEFYGSPNTACTLSAKLVFNSINCVNEDDIEVVIENGTPEYQIFIDNVQSILPSPYIISGLATGLHSIKIVDAYNCSVTRKLRVLR